MFCLKPPICSCFLICIFTFGISGCAYRPVAIDQSQIYIGAFKSKNKTVESCQFNEIKGLGLKLGVGIIGFGFFDRKIITAFAVDDGYCENEFFKVYMGNRAEQEIIKVGHINVFEGYHEN